MVSDDNMLAAHISFNIDELNPLFSFDLCTHVKRTAKNRNT